MLKTAFKFLDKVTPRISAKLNASLRGRFLEKINNLDRFRAFFFGVAEEHRGKGVEVVIMDEMLNEVARRNNVKYLNASWILESNTTMVKLMKNVLSEYDFTIQKFDIYQYEVHKNL